MFQSIHNDDNAALEDGFDQYTSFDDDDATNAPPTHVIPKRGILRT